MRDNKTDYVAEFYKGCFRDLIKDIAKNISGESEVSENELELELEDI